MVVYTNSVKSLGLLTHLFFRGGFKNSVKNIIKFIQAKKKIQKENFNYVAYTHKRLQENRVYGIFEENKKLHFFKLSEQIFLKIFNDDNKFLKALQQESQHLIHSNYKHRILTRIEFEKLGYGIKDSNYHGDVSKGNILAYNNDIILIDNEYKGEYSMLFQNVDYLFNLFINNSGEHAKFFNFNWWFIVVQMYTETTTYELEKVFKERIKNGCRLSNKILSNANSY